MYRLQSVRKCYGSNVALDIEELTIAKSRLYTLTGANGAGKSTLLSILAFLTPPTSGEIFYAGKRVGRDRGSVEELRKKVTLLHQSPYLFGNTVYANVAFGLKARGIRERMAKELSGGEAQRVAMARALALKPEVLLLDEPLANIDRETAGVIETVIASLPARGTTVVLITHDPEQPERLNGESILLEGGKVAIPHPPVRR